MSKRVSMVCVAPPKGMRLSIDGHWSGGGLDYDEGAAAERKRIVEWLRTRSELEAFASLRYADAIERGDHDPTRQPKP